MHKHKDKSNPMPFEFQWLCERHSIAVRNAQFCIARTIFRRMLALRCPKAIRSMSCDYRIGEYGMLVFSPSVDYVVPNFTKKG